MDKLISLSKIMTALDKRLSSTSVISSGTLSPRMDLKGAVVRPDGSKCGIENVDFV